MLSWTLGPLYIYLCFGTWATLHLLHFEVLIMLCVAAVISLKFILNYFSSITYFILTRLLSQVLERNRLNWNISISIDLIVTI